MDITATVFEISMELITLLNGSKIHRQVKYVTFYWIRLWL